MKDIVEQGLAGLANAGLVNGGNWFVGHFGAEALSLAFLLENNRVSNDTVDAVKKRIHAIFDAHPEFFKEPPRIETMDRAVELSDLVEHIERTIATFSVDGHHTIYAALALRAFALYPKFARPEVLQGLIILLDACHHAGSDRYYLLDESSLSDERLLSRFKFDSAENAAEVALGLQNRVITDREVDDNYYFFAGSRLHLVTHAQALFEFQQLGHKKLVDVGLQGLTRHVICVEASATPPGATPYTPKHWLDPRDASFWQRGKQNPHHGKLAYAALEIFEVLPNVDQRNALRDLSCYWEVYD